MVPAEQKGVDYCIKLRNNSENSNSMYPKTKRDFTDIDWERLAILYFIQDVSKKKYIAFNIGCMVVNAAILVLHLLLVKF